jgi:hypothetical protein
MHREKTKKEQILLDLTAYICFNNTIKLLGELEERNFTRLLLCIWQVFSVFK